MKDTENTRPNAPTSANVPKLRFPGFDGEWEKHKLSEYLVFKNGLNPSAKSFGDGIKFISVMDILNNPYITYDCIRASVDATEKEKKEFNVEYGDILFQRSSETIEDVGRSNVYLDRRSALYGGFTIRGKKNGDYHPMFFKYLLDSPYARRRIIVKGAGAQHFNISQEGLSSVSLNFPVIAEQEKIARFLSLLDQRIAIQNKTIEDLKKLKAALEEKIFASVQGHLTPLSEILVERVEKSSTNNQYEILSSTISGIYSQREYFNKDIASSDNTGYKVIHKSDIVLSPQNLWMGNINFNDKFDIGIVSPSYKVFSIRPEFDSRYVAFLLKTKRALWNYMLVSEQGASVVRRNLNIESFWGISFKIPSMDTQKRIGQGIRCIELKIEREMEYLAGLQKQKTFLLNNLFV